MKKKHITAASYEDAEQQAIAYLYECTPAQITQTHLCEAVGDLFFFENSPYEVLMLEEEDGYSLCFSKRNIQY